MGSSYDWITPVVRRHLDPANPDVSALIAELRDEYARLTLGVGRHPRRRVRHVMGVVDESSKAVSRRYPGSDAVRALEGAFHELEKIYSYVDRVVTGDVRRVHKGDWKRAHCRGCDRPYSVPGFIRKTEIGCTEEYAATGETAQQSWCAERERFV